MIDIHHHDSAPEKPNLYNALDQRLKQSSFGGSAAQAHGIASGLVCRDVKLAELDSAIERLNFGDETALSALESLFEMSQRDLNQPEFAFDLWLPEIDELEILLEAMAEWSQGFIIGLMYDGADLSSQLSDELSESIQDIIEISALESSNDDSTEAQVAFVELKEYLRMATQLIYEELNPERPIEAMPDS